MATELIINSSLPETRIVLMEDGEIQELLIERATGRGVVGNVYRGRVTRVLPGMQAAFVDIGLDKAAFLYVDDVYPHHELLGTKPPYSERKRSNGPNIPQGIVGKLPVPKETKAVAAQESPESLDSVSEEGLSVSTEEGEVNELGDQNQEAVSLADAEQNLESDDETSEPNFAEHLEDLHDPLIDDELEQTLSEELEDEEEDFSDESEEDELQLSQEEAVVDEAEQENEEPLSVGMETAAQPEKLKTILPPSSYVRHDRNHKGGRNHPRGRRPQNETPLSHYPEEYLSVVGETGDLESDRASLDEQGYPQGENIYNDLTPHENFDRRNLDADGNPIIVKKDFKQHRTRDRKIKPKSGFRQFRPRVNIQDVLKEGQEVIVQVAKEPIAAKGARLTCHISLPGRHLVCMPTIDHVGVSRRIERDDERRKLRDLVDRHRPEGMGFIVRTASSGSNSEQRIAQDIDYLSSVWTDIKDNTKNVSSPAIVYEDLNPILRVIRDWVNEDIDKIIIDNKKDFEEIKDFVSRFMPSVSDCVELYQGDIPIFDAYGISTDLHRSLERKVWLKSGGYIVVDQAEALVAIDVNTGRFVGKKNLEDTILKTNLEAVQEIAYQLRLRNCGGIIIIDFIDMEKDENRHRVYRALEEALKKDRSRPSILKISELGLVEMTRKRTRDTIVRALCHSCDHCEGKGFVKSKQTVAYEILRDVEREAMDRHSKKILIQAHPDVIEILAIEEREVIELLEKRLKKQILLQSTVDAHPEQYEVLNDKSYTFEEYIPKPNRGDFEKKTTKNDNRSHSGSSGRNSRQAEAQERHQPKGTSSIPAPLEKGAAPLVVPQQQQVTQPLDDDEQSEYEDLQNQNFLNSDSGDQDQSGDESPRGLAQDDFYDEEDRLAFLRAQAAQDAALASLSAGAAGGAPSTNGGTSPARAGQGRFRPNNNSRRGGGGGRNARGFGSSRGGGGAGRGRAGGGGRGRGPAARGGSSRGPRSGPAIPSGSGGDDSAE